MELVKIPSLVDNYIWLLIAQKKCIIIDPSTAQQVITFLHKQAIQPIAILLTHHHYDHVNGVPELKKYYPELVVYGPMETREKGTTVLIENINYLTFNDFSLQIFTVPGHTLGHVAYYHQPYLFSGDTIFSGGCGRILEGTAEQMYQSLEKLKALPDDTLVCGAHEYTAVNMAFASLLLPDDNDIKAYTLAVNKKITNQQSTLPSLLKQEKKINVFLRSNDPQLQAILGFSTNNYSTCDVFTKIRSLKDSFNQ